VLERRDNWLTVLLLGLTGFGIGMAIRSRGGLYSAGAVAWLTTATVTLLASLFCVRPGSSRAPFVIAIVLGIVLAAWSRVAFEIAYLAIRGDDPDPVKQATWLRHGYLRLNLSLGAFAIAAMFGLSRIGHVVRGRTVVLVLGAYAALAFLLLWKEAPGSAFVRFEEKEAIVAPLSEGGTLFQGERHAALQRELAGVPQRIQNAATRKERIQAEQRGKAIEAAFKGRTYQMLLLPAGAFAAVAFSRNARWARVAFALLLATMLLTGAWVIRKTPAPYIDVWVFQQEACKALLEGRNPYSMRMPNIYEAGIFVYAPDLMKGGRLEFGYPYPPLSLFLALPGYLIGGDHRYSQLAAIVAAAALTYFARPGRLGLIGALMILFTSRFFYVLEQAWTEPFVVLGLAGTVFAACRYPKALPYVLGLFLATKQYLLFVPPLVVLLVEWPIRWKDLGVMLAKAAAVAALVSLPLILWDVRAFWHSAVTLQAKQPFRNDALSFLVWLYWNVSRGTAESIGTKLAFAGAVAAVPLAIRRWPRTPGGFAAGVGLVYFVFFMFNRQAFANYYFFVLSAFAVAVATMRSGSSTMGDDADVPPDDAAPARVV
jgi:hypothetical protein